MTSVDIEIHDDIVELCARETLELVDAVRLFDIYAGVRRDRQRAFILARADGPGITTEARKYVTEWFRNSAHPVECAVFGTGALQRAIIEMIQRAVQFLSPGKMILVSFKTRDEALAWIAARRREPAPASPGAREVPAAVRGPAAV